MLMTPLSAAAMDKRARFFTPTPVPDEAARIGRRLAALVDDGNIRAMEAIACVMVRCDWGRISAALADPPTRRTRLTPALLAAGERVARRALAGGVGDRTNGATRFHRLGDLPAWARRQLPVAQVGDFLFYRL